MHRLCVLLSLGLPLWPASARAASAPSETPHDVVAAIYAREIADEAKKAGNTAFTDRPLRKRYFSKGFDRLILRDEAEAAREQSVGAIDFDPVISGQDGEVKKLTIENARIAGDRATVSAHFSSFGQATVVTYDLVKEDGGWAVDDIKGKLEKDRWSVRDILERAQRKK